MQGIENYPQIFIVSTLIMLTLVGFIIFFVLVYQRRLTKQQFKMLEQESLHQQQLLSATIATQEVERQRIARDLHDEIGGMLSAVKMNLGRAKRKVKDDETLSPLLVETTDMLTDSIQNVRNISHALLPPLLEKFGLESALKNLVEKSSSEDEKESVLKFQSQGESRRLGPQKELGLYRVALEVINNARKHAKAKQISISLNFLTEKTLLEIKDDGVGFNLKEVKEKANGLGLKNIESRIQTIGAEWEFDSEEGKGTILKINLPYENSAS